MNTIHSLLRFITAFGLFAGASLYAATATETFKDTFSTVSYGNNDGTLSFSTDWIETGDDGSPDSGTFSIRNGTLYLDNIDRDTIERHLDLTGALSAQLTLDYVHEKGRNDWPKVQLWNAATSSWEDCDDGNNGEMDDENGTITCPLSSDELSSESGLRILSATGTWGTNDEFSIDNVQFSVRYEDTDADGVPDLFDLDDDNDGIPDVKEMEPTLFTFTQSNNDANGTVRGIYGGCSGDFTLTQNLYQGYGAQVRYTTYDGKPGIEIFHPASSDNPDAFGYTITLGNLSAGSVPILGIRQRIGKTTGNNEASDFNASWSGGGKASYLDFASPSATMYRYGAESDFDLNNRQIAGLATDGLLESGESFRVYAVKNADADWSVSFPRGITEIRMEKRALTGGTSTTEGEDVRLPLLGYDSASASGATYNEWIAFTVSCLLDSDGDGIPDDKDLDSDNDGIPDNIEAQSTQNYVAPSGVDADGDGLDDAYDPDQGGTPIAQPDTDGDGIPDSIDTDSDNDGYTDCEEGIVPSQGAACPLSGSVGVNGMLDSLESADDYHSPNNGIDDPTPSKGWMQDEYAGANGEDTQAAYREFMCGKNLTALTAYNWRLISVPCNTGSRTVRELFGQILGDYGEPEDGGHWVMYRQTGTDHYEVNATHKNTDKEKLTADSTLSLGHSYWIITDANRTVTIDKTLSGLAPTPTSKASVLGIEDPDFEKAGFAGLPDGTMSVPGNVKKYMAGNPFPYAFEMRNLYFSPDKTVRDTYRPMGDSANDPYIDPVFYKHDSPDVSDKNVSGGGGYVAVDAGTPGFAEGGFKAMEGFFIIIQESNATDNGFAYPLMMNNGSGN